jgi:hypothetical protein
MFTFIDMMKDRFGVDLVCRAMRAAEVGFVTAHRNRAAKSQPASARTLSDQLFSGEIVRLHAENFANRYSIKNATLLLDYKLGLLSGLEDGFVDCVAFALTDDGAEGIDRASLQERGLFTLSRGESGAALTITPTP